MAIQKTYQYKVWNTSGTYLGLIPNVTSDFGYNQTIASAGTQITFNVALSADTANLPVTSINAEDNNPITDESSNNLLIERQPDAVGSGNALAQISNNNQIQVWEYSKYYPNGLLKFAGYISKWQADFGTSDDITVTCINNGQDLSQYYVQSGNSPAISQTVDNGTTFGMTGGGAKTFPYGQGQNFTAGSNFSCGGIEVEVTTTEAGTLSIYLYTGTLSTSEILNPTAIASGSINVGVLTKSVQTIQFLNPTALTNGSAYNFVVWWSPTSGSNTAASIFANSGSTAQGNSVQYNVEATYYQTSGSMNGADLYFVILQAGTGLSGTYTNVDPSYMMTSVINNYVQRGGYATIPTTPIIPLVSALNSDNAMSTGYWGNAFAQIFTPTTNMTINILQLYLGVTSGSYSWSISIVKGNPSTDTASVTGGSYSYTFGSGNTTVATSSSTTFSNTSAGITTFTFATPVTLTAGQSYYIFNDGGQGAWSNLIWYGSSSVDTIADTQVGHLYLSKATINNASANPAYSSTYPALYFALAYQLPLPTNLSGGYNNTGVTTSYSFKTITVLSAIQAIDTLAPSNWYWYVDPATNYLYWKIANSVADITIIKGRHINTLQITATKENIKNSIYLTGGDDGTGTSTNVFVNLSVPASPNRVGLGVLSDNRINGNTNYLGSKSAAIAVATQIVNEYLADNSSETYQSTITIQDTTIDINKFTLGLMLGFSGFGTFVDNLLLQIVGVNYSPDQVTLQLGTLPVIQSQTVQSIEAGLQNTNVANNPVSPTSVT